MSRIIHVPEEPSLKLLAEKKKTRAKFIHDDFLLSHGF